MSAPSISGSQRLEFAVLAHARRVAGDEVQVRAVALQDLSQKGVDGWHGAVTVSRRHGGDGFEGSTGGGAPAKSVTNLWN